MNNIHNFAARQLCQYHTIFPTTASLLDHLLFVIGNGYDFNTKTGMPKSGKKDIDKYPEMTPAAWDKLITECHQKEDHFAQQYRGRMDDDVINSMVEDNKTGYYARYTTDEMFSEDALYSDLLTTKADRAAQWLETFYRPYPLSQNYSLIFDLNTTTPKWFVQIALNFCKAWVRFLDAEIATGNVYAGPPTPLVGSQFIGSVDDYANLVWTTKHRDIIAEQVQRLTILLENV